MFRLQKRMIGGSMTSIGERTKVKKCASLSLFRLSATFFCFIFMFGWAACGIDYGTLFIADIEVTAGKSVPVGAVFSKEAEEIEYMFEGDAISIEGDVVYARRAGVTVEVTAKTEHMQTEFKVTTLAPDYGTLTIPDIEGLAVGQRRRVRTVFSQPMYAETVAYNFEGNAISIENGFVTALLPDARVEVSAKTEHHSASFVVTTIENYGTLFIEDVTAWIGYPPSDFTVGYSRPETASGREISYEYDDSMIELDAQAKTIRALKAGETTVRAGDGVLQTQFSVVCAEADKSGNEYNTADYDAYAAQLAVQWEQRGNEGQTTLFIGDSFFDTRYFWTDFYRAYEGKDALCFGISSTTTYDWEVFAEETFAGVRPKNIVVHLGTNNIYDDAKAAEETCLALRRLFTLLRDRFGGAHIYYFGISVRSYGTEEIGRTRQVNADISAWCGPRDWITYIDTPTRLATDMLRDGVHPKLEYYSVFTDALAETDIVIEDLQ